MGKGETFYVIDGNLLPVCTLVQPLWRAISKIIWQFSVSQRCTHLWASNSIPNRDLETLSRGYTRDTSWQQQKIRNNLSICQQEHRLITFGVVIYKSQVDWYISTWTDIKRWVTKAGCRMIDPKISVDSIFHSEKELLNEGISFLLISIKRED